MPLNWLDRDQEEAEAVGHAAMLDELIEEAEVGVVPSVRGLVRLTVCLGKGSTNKMAADLGVSKEEIHGWMLHSLPRDIDAVVSWCVEKVRRDGITLCSADPVLDVQLMDKVVRCEHESYGLAPDEVDRGMRLVVVGLLRPSLLRSKRAVLADDATRRFLKQ